MPLKRHDNVIINNSPAITSTLYAGKERQFAHVPTLVSSCSHAGNNLFPQRKHNKKTKNGEMGNLS